MKKFIEKHKMTHMVSNKKIDRSIFFEMYGDNDFLYHVIAEYGGTAFDNGLFKIHTFEYVDKWTALLSEYFRKEIKSFNMICFASNWQGCMYCIDKYNRKITYFDPATCEFFDADSSLQTFFDDILVSGEYDIIFEDYFKETLGYLKLDNVKYEDSVGHKVYLHLGGEDDVDNLEVVNTETLWDLQIQIAESINEIDAE
jgi:hypothetical protein